MKHLADEYVTVVESPDPEHVWCYSPGLLRLESGRIIATMDFGGAGVKDMDGACRRYPDAVHAALCGGRCRLCHRLLPGSGDSQIG